MKLQPCISKINRGRTLGQRLDFPRLRQRARIKREWLRDARTVQRARPRPGLLAVADGQLLLLGVERLESDVVGRVAIARAAAQSPADVKGTPAAEGVLSGSGFEFVGLGAGGGIADGEGRCVDGLGGREEEQERGY